jgi:hypothetical protein
MRNWNTFIHSFIYSFIHQWLYRPLLGPGLVLSFVIYFTQSVGLLGRVISPLQGRCLHTGQHKHGINAYIHQTSMPWVRSDPTIPAFEGAKTVHALDRAGTVIGYLLHLQLTKLKYYSATFQSDNKGYYIAAFSCSAQRLILQRQSWKYNFLSWSQMSGAVLSRFLLTLLLWHVSNL